MTPSSISIAGPDASDSAGVRRDGPRDYAGASMATLSGPAAGQQSGHAVASHSTATLALLALGIVYGDIGTSPLYAVKETFNPEHGIPLDASAILGGVSAIFWTLMIVVSLKYVVLVAPVELVDVAEVLPELAHRLR